MKAGWFIHGRAGTEDLMSEFKKHEIYVSLEPDIAESYAGDRGSMWLLKPKNTAKILDATSDTEISNVVEALKSAYNNDRLGNYDRLRNEIQGEIEDYGENKGWSRITEALQPADIVSDAGYYGDTEFMNWLGEESGFDFVRTNRGGVAYNPEAFEIKRVVKLVAIPKAEA